MSSLRGFPARLGAASLACALTLSACQPGPGGVTVEVSYPEAAGADALDGRLILVFSARDEGEPRFHVTDGAAAQPVFGLDVDRKSVV